MRDNQATEAGVDPGSPPPICYFRFMDGDSVVSIVLDPETAGYALDGMSDMVRLYDKNNTYLLHQQYLVLFKFPVRKCRS